MLNLELQTAAYIGAIILFIKSLGGLGSQETAQKGNYFGMLGMIIAIVATILGPNIEGIPYLMVAFAIAAVIGVAVAIKVEMTQMPQLVALLHSFVGLAAVLVGFDSYLHNATSMTHVEHIIHLIEICIGIFVGAITFTGSIIAFGKLQGVITGSPWALPGKHFINILIVVGTFALGYFIIVAPGISGLTPLLALTLISSILGILLVMAIGGGDMPVVVSMLNSYSGWAAAAAGFMLSNDLLIVTGALVGSSGAILSYIMCKAMNRSIVNVIFGGIGTAPPKAQSETDQDMSQIKSLESCDVANLLKNAKKVIIVPGYGMAVAKAQYFIQEMTSKLQEIGVDVKFAIHPVAGRLPGHMNVLLAEARVPYDVVYEMDEINDDLPETDVVLVVGANDIVNPGAEDDSSSPIYGMPVIQVWNAKNVIVLKRSMGTGYAGIQNPLFFKENTQMLFGDAKDSIKGMCGTFMGH